jgi:hypothetical protein
LTVVRWTPSRPGQAFLGQREPVAAGPVLGVEQPAGGARLDRVKGIAGDRLHDLGEQASE